LITTIDLILKLKTKIWSNFKHLFLESIQKKGLGQNLKEKIRKKN